MNLPDRDTTTYYISSIGEEATKLLFHLTDGQLDNILEDKVFGEPVSFRFKEKSKEYKEFTSSSSPDLKELERVITENYREFYKMLVLDKWKINTRSLSREDVLQEGLLSILKNADSFKYVDYETTKRYIKHALKGDRLNAERDSRLTQDNHNIFREVAFKEEGFEELDSLANNVDFIDSLSPNQFIIFNLLIEGNTQEAIAEQTGVTQPMIFKQAKIIKKKIKYYIE